MQRKKVLVIGLGRFGGALADELWDADAELIVVDKDPDAVDAYKTRASAAFVGDASDPAVLERNFQVNVMALLHLARHLTPAMVAAGEGAIVITGNTSALRGKANFAGFAPTKAAQRILAESMARELGPKGVHVAYLVIDAVIDLAWTRKRWPNAGDDFFIQPAHIADEVWRIAHQPRSAWSFNVEIRPFGETW